MTKIQYQWLEKAFDEFSGDGLIQSKSKVVQGLCDKGWLKPVRIVEPPTRQCPFKLTVDGFKLTDFGVRIFIEEYERRPQP